MITAKYANSSTETYELFDLIPVGVTLCLLCGKTSGRLEQIAPVSRWLKAFSKRLKLENQLEIATHGKK